MNNFKYLISHYSHHAFVLLVTLFATFSPSLSSAETLVFSAAPRETAQQGQKLYGPVADFISQTLGKKVEYQHTKYWLRYQSNIKKHKYDFVMDGPHLGSWRIKNIRHTPLIKLPGSLQFYMLARADDKMIKTPKDLVYKKVCVIPPPNLTAMTLLRELNDPVREPFIVGIKGGMKKLVNSLVKGKCRGTVVRKGFYDNKLGDELKSKVKIIHTSKKLPNQVITVSDRISKDEKIRLVEALLSEKGKAALAPLIKRFGGKGVVSFIRASEHEYDEYYNYLEGVVLGW